MQTISDKIQALFEQHHELTRGQIAAKLEMPRVSIQRSLKSLLARGLVREVDASGVEYFSKTKPTVQEEPKPETDSKRISDAWNDGYAAGQHDLLYMIRQLLVDKGAKL